jgi:hypothetical protein
MNPKDSRIMQVSWIVPMPLKILLISPIGLKKILGAEFFFKLPFLGLPTIAAYTPPDCQVKMVDDLPPGHMRSPMSLSAGERRL